MDNNQALNPSLSTLPDFIQSYLKKLEEKRNLNRLSRALSQEIKSMQPEIMAWMSSHNKIQIPIHPENEDQASAYGPLGSIVFRSRNEYERLNRSSLLKLSLKFWSMMNHGDPPEEIEKTAQGMVEFMWGNRECQNLQYLERTYPTQAKTGKKRPRVEQNVPKKADDFLG